MHADLHKQPQEAYASELGVVLGELQYALRHLAQWMKPRRGRWSLLTLPGSARIHPEPYGVALIVAPWNYPFQLLFTPLVGAIAAGNCACLKPSELAPRTSAVMATLIRVTFPQEYIAIVEGGRAETEALLEQRFDSIFFTGSARVGRSVMAAAARHLSPVTLELGGKSPCIVCADSPLEVTARRIAWGKFMNAGQTCVAPDYLLVERSIRDALIEALARAIGEFYGPDPLVSPDYGRIINRQHFDRLVGYLGAGTVMHGGQSSAKDLSIAPTILTDVPFDSPVMEEEIFGPILPVIDFTDFEEVLALMRNRPSPLALYLFTKNRQTQQRIVAEVPSGGVCINDTVSHLIAKELPFGGVGESGMGSYHGQASFDCFSHRKSVMTRYFWGDPGMRYPPFLQPFGTFKRIYRFMMSR
ncbi:MAG: aldehyde dehydrogenase [Verrucomicrobia bacterium]|nr:aldehyde dehydrogenase [Verrucomicrobiota bacterium]